MLLEFVNFHQLTKKEKQMSGRLCLQALMRAVPINKSDLSSSPNPAIVLKTQAISFIDQD